MPLARIQRPKWDEETLPQLGFEIIQIQPCLNAVVYNIQDQMKYEHIPLHKRYSYFKEIYFANI